MNISAVSTIFKMPQPKNKYAKLILQALTPTGRMSKFQKYFAIAAISFEGYKYYRNKEKKKQIQKMIDEAEEEMKHKEIIIRDKRDNKTENDKKILDNYPRNNYQDYSGRDNPKNYSSKNYSQYDNNRDYGQNYNNRDYGENYSYRDYNQDDNDGDSQDSYAYSGDYEDDNYRYYG